MMSSGLTPKGIPYPLATDNVDVATDMQGLATSVDGLLDTVAGGGPHASTHGELGADPVTLTQAQVTGLTAALAGKQPAGSYAAASHTHGATDLSGVVKTVNSVAPDGSGNVNVDGGTVADATLTTKGVVQLAGDLGGTAASPTVPGLASKANTSHAHTIGDVTGLQTALDGKAASLGIDDNYVTDAEKTKLANLSGTNTGDQTWTTLSGKPAVIAAGATQADARTAIGAGTSSFSGSYSNLTDVPTSFTPSAHSHAISDTTGLQTALDGKAATSHSHAISDVTNLQTTLDGKASSTAPGLYGRYVGVNAQTGTSYTPVLGDEGKLVTLTNAAAITVTLPSDANLAMPVGATVDFVGLGAGLVTFQAGSGATANATPSLVTRAQYSAVSAIKAASNAWLVVGDLA